jgi:hypothetical protein
MRFNSQDYVQRQIHNNAYSKPRLSCGMYDCKLISEYNSVRIVKWQHADEQFSSKTGKQDVIGNLFLEVIGWRLQQKSTTSRMESLGSWLPQQTFIPDKSLFLVQSSPNVKLIHLRSKLGLENPLWKE